ncbi:MAG TPA: GNAT family N-acetyltransferase [Candidatus Limnocylindrales bacterium]
MTPPSTAIRTRAAVPADLPACERIWRDGINDYIRRLNQPDVPEDNPGLRRLHAHTLATDPARFRVAEREGEVVAFGSAVQRGPLWFLSMLFVTPGAQAKGVGRRLLAEIGPDSPGDGPAAAARLPVAAGAPEPRSETILGTVTDSAQPISNGLYSSMGIVPRMPLWNLVGRPGSGWQAPPLPPGVTAARFPDDPVSALEIDALDREIVGFDHPQDHAFLLAGQPDRFAYRAAGGDLLGYGYTSAVGRIGPVAVRDPSLMGPVVGHLLTAVVPRGASAIWLPGGSTGAVAVALDAGLRYEDWPLLLCWSRPFADFERYLPISPGLP